MRTRKPAPLQFQQQPLPKGCEYWVRTGAPDPLWNNGAFAQVRRAMVTRGLLTETGHWTEGGFALRKRLVNGEG